MMRDAMAAVERKLRLLFVADVQFGEALSGGGEAIENFRVP